MLKGRVAVVTGGAQGIGKHAAKTLAENGVKVVIADLNKDAGEKTAAELNELSEAIAISLDVRDEDNVRETFDTVAKKFGQIDILVNNAGVVPHFRWGVPHWPQISEMPFEFWDRVIRTNLYGTFFAPSTSSPT